MLSPSEFNNAVPKFTNGNYANNPVDPQYIEEPTLQDYNRGVEPLETLPAQWWNWLCNQFTSRFNKINTYVKNIFDEITQLLSLLNISPDGTESAITTGQLKNFFKELYPTYVSDKLELGTTYVPQTRTVNGHALTGNITITKSDVGLGNVDNTSDVDKPVSTAQATAISTAIGALDVASVGGDDKYISAISETDGIISATAKSASIAVIAGDNAPVSGGAVAQALKDYPNVTYYNRLESENLDCNNITDRVCLVTALNSNWQDLHYPFQGLVFIITANNENGEGFQKAISWGLDGTYPEYTRVCKNGVWQSWKKVLTADDVTNQVTNGDSAPVSSGAVADILSNLPTDAVLHYSFDDLPDYPDGVAVLRQLSFDSTSGWVGSNTSFSIENSALKMQSNGTWQLIAGTRYEFSVDNLKNRIVKITIQSPYSIQGAFFQEQGGAYPSYYLTEISRNGNERIFIGKMPELTYLCYLVFDMGSTSSNNYVLLNSIYIGDGSYATPIIDNANGKWNSVSQSGVAVNGVSGKAIRFLGGNYIRGNLPWKPYDKAVFTVSMWVKNWDTSTDLELINDWDTFEDRPTPLFAKIYSPSTSHNVALYIYVKTEGNYIRRFQILKNNFDYNELNDIAHIVVVFNDTNSVIYINGKKFELLLIDVYPLDSQVINNQFFQVGAANTNTNAVDYTKATFDDLLIFDRALTEKEVLALYYNKANTPKYYDLDDYKFANGDTAPTASSNNFVESKTLYNFFGGNTSAQSWLGKVFGWALGKNWTQATGYSTTETISCIYYANGTWVVGGSSQGIWWSTDGKSWTQVTGSIADKRILTLYYSNGIWLAGTSGNGLWWSTDGKSWTQGTGDNTSHTVHCVRYANNIWVAGTQGNGFWWSTDGKSWTQGSNTTATVYDVYFGDGIWVSACSGKLRWSTDGKNWTNGTVEGTVNPRVVYFADNVWKAASPAGILTSTDGKDWSVEKANGNFTDIYYANGVWVAVGINAGAWIKKDTSSWTQTDLTIPSVSVYYANNIWVVSSSNRGFWWSTNGETWIPSNVSDYIEGGSTPFVRVKTVCYGDGTWIAGSLSRAGLWWSSYENASLE